MNPLSRYKKLTASIAASFIVCTLTACDQASSSANAAKSVTHNWSVQEKQLLLTLSIRELPEVAEDLSNQYQKNPSLNLKENLSFFQLCGLQFVAHFLIG